LHVRHRTDIPGGEITVEDKRPLKHCTTGTNKSNDYYKGGRKREERKHGSALTSKHPNKDLILECTYKGGKSALTV
jgi:hypothetical protein